MEFVPPFAPLVVLAFLGTAFLLGVGALLFLYAAIARKRAMILTVLLGTTVIIGLYGGALVTASALSRERLLLPGEKKYFCEIDCHLAYSVDGVEIARDLGVPPRTAHAAGQFHIVALRTWFDESTTSPKRPRDVPLYPNPRVVYVMDESGRRYEPSIDAESALAAMGRTSTPLTQPLRPGESYETYLVFDLPENVKKPRLFVGAEPTVEFVLIGHEMSPWHRKVWFAMR
jgi:hypothetical protein